MIEMLLISTLLAIQPGDPSGETIAMPREIAQSRIRDVIQNETDPDLRLKTLQEVIDRTEDATLVSIAQFNLGLTQLELSEEHPEQTEPAIEALKAADRIGAGARIQSKARFALGHAYYQIAQTTEPSSASEPGGDPQAMIDAMKEKISILRSSAGAFRSVMEVDASNTRASANVERVRKEIKTLQDQIDAIEKMMEQQKEQQQREQQQKQQQQQDAADKLKELAKEQQQQADQSAEKPTNDEQEQAQRKQEQSEVGEKTDAAKEDVAQQQDTQEIQEKIQEAQEAQKRALEAMEQGDQEQAAKEQAKAAKSLDEAAEKMQEMADESKEKNEQDKPGDEGEKGEPQDGEEGQSDQESEDELGPEISEIAKELLEKERREREMRQPYRQKGRPTKVEKDW